MYQKPISGGTLIMYKRVEHLKISLEVQMINIISIKADDIFMGKISTDAITSKVNHLVSNFLIRPQVTLPLALSYDSKFMTQTKVKTKKRERS